MKKITLRTIAVLLVTAASITGTSAFAMGKTDKADGDKIIKVASHTPPMTDMLELVREDLAAEGYELEIVKVSDNVQANVALHNKEVDANFFQHALFMGMYNEKNNANLVSLQPVYNAIVAFYGRNIKSIEDIKEGATVAIPSDPTNQSRALRLLAAYKMISLKDPSSYKVSLEDIKDNPKNLQFESISLLNLNEAYKEKDLVFNYPTYIAKIGLKPQTDGIMIEDEDTTFAIMVATRQDNMDSPKMAALKKVMTNEKIQKFIKENLKGHATQAF